MPSKNYEKEKAKNVDQKYMYDDSKGERSGMKKLFLVANWKSHKNSTEAHLWMQEFLNHDFVSWIHVASGHDPVQKTVVICPPAPLLPLMHSMVSSFPVSIPLRLGAQNVSAFAEGSHTGEEPAEMLKEFVSFVIIGHSERRKEENETDEVLARKVQRARECHIEPIFCVQGKETPVPEGVHMIAYEPLDAIGTGHPESPENANEVAQYFKKQKQISFVLYGGSVTEENVSEFTSQEYLDGVLVGTASLKAEQFARVVQNA